MVLSKFECNKQWILFLCSIRTNKEGRRLKTVILLIYLTHDNKTWPQPSLHNKELRTFYNTRYLKLKF